MSIDDRLRAALPLVLDDLQADVEQGLALTLRRVERRRSLRRGGYAVAVVAAATVMTAVALGVHEDQRSLEPVEPPVDRVRVLDAGVGTASNPAPLEAGTYAIGFLGASDEAPHAILDVPAGWGHDRLHPVTGPDLDPHLRRIELSTVSMVAPDPCRRDRSSIGPSAADLTDAIAAQTRVLPGSPRPITVDGFSGRVVEVRVPSHLDTTRCDNEQKLVPFWVDTSTYTTVFPGWTYLVWAFHVEGERLVVTGALGPDVTPDERAELIGIVEGLELVPPV